MVGRHRLVKGGSVASLTTHTSRDSPSGALRATVMSGSTVMARPPGSTVKPLAVAATNMRTA